MELLTISAIATVVSAVLLTFFAQQSAWLETATTVSELRSQSQLALASMMSDLRQTTRKAAGSPPNISIPVPPANTAMTLYLPADLDGNEMIIDAAGNLEWDELNPVQYQSAPASRQLQRVAGAGVRVLANDLAGVAFEDETIDGALGADEVRIRLTLQRTTPSRRTVSTTSSAIVKLRN